MKPSCLTILIPVLLCAATTVAVAQDSVQNSITRIPSKYFAKVSDKADHISDKLDAKTAKALLQFQKREQKIKSKLYKIDSLAANNIFTAAEQRYKQLEGRLNGSQKLTQYIPFLDTLKTSLKFFDKNKGLLGKGTDMQQQLDGAMSKINGLEQNLQKAEQVKQFLKEQKQFLKQQLEKFGFAKQLKKLNKDVYYYSQQIAEYKQTLNDPQKLERKAIDLVSRTKLFQDFMKKNSMLASLFRMPADDPNDPAYLQSLAGLQTRAQVNQVIQNQIGSGGANAIGQVTANVQQAQGLLQQLKDKAAQYGKGATDDDMPDFRPNNQKTKSFLQRLEYGTTIQSQRSNSYFPVTSDIGLSIGYKLNDRSVIGVGGSYKMGWGQNIRHMKITHQGIGLRSYIDWKIASPFGNKDKGIASFWLSGGFEMNYHTEFKKIEQLRDYKAWQQSGLIGITKRFPVNTKFIKNTKVQLLWDFLSYSQLPRTKPIVFRVGYNIN